MKDGDATKENILETFLDYQRVACSPDDRLLFFFAGHGMTQPGYTGEVGYVIPVDGNPDRISSLIRFDDLTRNADVIPAKHILFIFDSCFSGLATQRVAYPSAKRFLLDMLQRRSRQVMTAGKADEVVADGGGPQGKNSIFTGHLIEGLNGAAVDNVGILTASVLMNYVYQKLYQDPKSKQTPHYGNIDGDGDFVLINPDGDLQKKPESNHILSPVPEMPGTQQSSISVPTQIKQSFSEQNGYLNPQSPNFGRNQYSAKLGSKPLTYDSELEKALSWFSVVLEPVNGQEININLKQLLQKKSTRTPMGEQQFEKFDPPSEIMTTINSIVLYDWLSGSRKDFWARYVRIEKSGNLEFCESFKCFFVNQDVRVFRYIQIIGMTWQVMFFAKRLLSEYNYQGAARLLVNLVGTKDSILAHFAQSPGPDNQHWIEPGVYDAFSRGRNLLELKCTDDNLQLEYDLVLGNLDEQSSKEIIVDMANQLSLAYNHKSDPRCFIHGTDTFPWNEYHSDNW